MTPDGTTFASGHGSVRCPAEGPCVDIAPGFYVWNAASGTPQFALEDGDIDGLVESVAFSRDGKLVAFGMTRSSEDQIRVYNYPEYTLQGSYTEHGTGTYCTAFSPTANLLTTDGADGTVRLWDVSSGNLVYGLPAGAGRFGVSSATVAFFPHGRYLVSGCARYVSPEWGGLIRIWDMADGSLAREYTEETVGSVGSSLFVAVSPAAVGWIAYTYDHKVKFVETGLGFEEQATDSATPVQGRLVRSLLNEVRSAGANQVNWDGRDQAGRGAASGTYFARLESGGRTSVKAMVLVR